VIEVEHVNGDTHLKVILDSTVRPGEDLARPSRSGLEHDKGSVAGAAIGMLGGKDRAEGKAKGAADLVDVRDGFFGYETKLKGAGHETVSEIDTGDLDCAGDLGAGAIGRASGSKIQSMGVASGGGVAEAIATSTCHLADVKFHQVGVRDQGGNYSGDHQGIVATEGENGSGGPGSAVHRSTKERRAVKIRA
jgi:hypothetical protein